MDVGSDLLSKQEYLNMIDLPPSPFSVGALNAFHSEDRVPFFEFFSAVYHYCTFNHQQLVAHTFALCDSSGSGVLTVKDLTILVHFVYGTHVAKAEAGLIVTTNKTDIRTEKQVMHNLDPQNTGGVTLSMFDIGVRKHANLLNPAFQTQQHIRRAVGGVDLWKAESVRLAKFCEANNTTTNTVYREIYKALSRAEKKKAERGQGKRQSSTDTADSDDDDTGDGGGGGGGGGGTSSALYSHQDALAGMGQRGRGLSAGAYDLDGLEKKDSSRRASAGPTLGGGAGPQVSNTFRHRTVKLEDTWVTSHVPLAKDSLIGNPTGGPAAAAAAAQSSIKVVNKSDSGGKWAQAKNTVAGASAARRGGARGSGSEKVHPSPGSKHGQPVLLMYDIED